ncbi:MAG: VWA domain-containing protein [Acidobacteria bacterium]|nr:VWA domain-containing protein [Acidobacteriota bacterium]
MLKSLNVAALLILAIASSIVAQTPTPTPRIEDDNEVIKVESRLIVVPVSVTDSTGQPVAGLTANDFLISEENRPQEIAQVTSADKVPLEIALLFDISATTSPMFDFQLQTAIKFLQDVMRPEDRATIFTIGERPVMISARETAERSAIAIKTIQPTKQFTSFYDTVRQSADFLIKNAPAGTRRVVVTLSDGEDTNSDAIRDAINDGYRKLGRRIDSIDSKTLYQLTIKNRDEASVREQGRVLRFLQNADTVFYSINSAGNSYQLNKGSLFGQANMQRFADDTGGTAFLPKFQPVTLKDPVLNSYNNKKNQDTLTDIFRKLTNELRAQYLVQYYSDADYPENQYINLKVLLKAGSHRVRARQGYFVKK